MFGYMLDLRISPIKFFLKKKKPRKSALNNSYSVKRLILKLLGKDLVRECSEAPFYVNSMTVSEPANAKERLILD